MMIIILSKEEVSTIFTHIVVMVAADNPAPLESKEVKEHLIAVLKDLESYPEIAALVEETPLLKHILLFSPYDIQINPLGEMYLYVNIETFDTKGH